MSVAIQLKLLHNLRRMTEWTTKEELFLFLARFFPDKEIGIGPETVINTTVFSTTAYGQDLLVLLNRPLSEVIEEMIFTHVGISALWEPEELPGLLMQVAIATNAEPTEITWEQLAPLMDRPMVEVVPRLSPLMGYSRSFHWRPWFTIDNLEEQYQSDLVALQKSDKIAQSMNNGTPFRTYATIQRRVNPDGTLSAYTFSFDKCIVEVGGRKISLPEFLQLGGLQYSVGPENDPQRVVNMRQFRRWLKSLFSQQYQGFRNKKELWRR